MFISLIIVLVCAQRFFELAPACVNECGAFLRPEDADLTPCICLFCFAALASAASRLNE